MTNTQPPSLRRNLSRALVLSLSFPLGALLALGLIAGLAAADIVEIGRPEADQSALGETADSIRPPVETSPAYVLAQHADQCWTIDDETQHLPSAAIVTITSAKVGPVGTAFYTDDAAIVDAAFSEVLHSIGFDEEPLDRHFDVIALCDR